MGARSPSDLGARYSDRPLPAEAVVEAVSGQQHVADAGPAGLDLAQVGGADRHRPVDHDLAYGTNDGVLRGAHEARSAGAAGEVRSQIMIARERQVMPRPRAMKVATAPGRPRFGAAPTMSPPAARYWWSRMTRFTQPRHIRRPVSGGHAARSPR